jgi:transposase-like protein
LLDRSTLRRIRDRTKTKDHSWHWRSAQKYADHIPSPLQNLKTNLSKASKILLLDGIYVKIKGKDNCVHIAFDTNLGVVDFWQDCTENKQAYGYILARLTEIEYAPICVVSDGHGGIKALCKENKIPHQRCIFHILRYLKDQLSDRGELLKANKVLYSRLKGILKSSTIESLEMKATNFRTIIMHFQSPRQKRTLEWFFKALPSAVIHLSFAENIPRTSNLLENLNGQIRARLKTFRGVKSQESLDKILKILFRFRNYK